MEQLYKFLTLIPKWKVITYKNLGEIFNLTPRQVAKILANNKLQDKYPCYKVINSNLQVWGYNLWVNEKIRKLKNEWIKIINNKVDKKHLWNYKLKNFFCAIPLESNQVEKFQQLVKLLQKLNNWSFTIQKPQTPHITIKFFWNISLNKFHEIIQNTSSLKLSKKHAVLLQKVDNFNQRVYFYKPAYQKPFYDIYLKFSKINNFLKEPNFQPHLTVIRVKDNKKFNQIKPKVLKILNTYSFFIKLNKIRFYLGIDNHFQVEIKDIYL